MIDPSTIQRIIETADILDVVGDFVSLKKKGTNYWGLCPFHSEKTPSFSVSPVKGIYKCFGCGKGGNALNFIMDSQQMTYMEALKYLANKYNIPVEETILTEEQMRAKTERESLMAVTDFAHQFFVEQLHHTDEGRQIGLSYFHSRGMSDDIITTFALGYSPDKSDALTQEALTRGYKKEYLIKVGLTLENEYGLHDRFRGRVIFPIRNASGKVIAFGGRVMSQNPKMAKYVNSPESEIYHKSQVLFGLDLAKRTIIDKGFAYLVEGYTDVTSMHAKRITNVVASSGTSLTVEQIRILKRMVSDITIIYDGDAAGIKASIRGIDMVLKEGLNVRIVALPQPEDPDSFARAHTPDEINAFLEQNSVDFITFKTNLLLADIGSDSIRRANLVKEIVASIAKIPNPINQSIFLKQTATQLNVDENALIQELKNTQTQGKQTTHGQDKVNIAPKEPHPSKTTVQKPAANGCEKEEVVLVRYLLNYGNTYFRLNEAENITVGDFLLSELEEDELELTHPLLRTIVETFKAKQQEPGFNPATFFIKHPDPQISAACANLLSEKYALSKMWSKFSNVVEKDEEQFPYILPKIVNNYKIKRVQMAIKEVDVKIKALDQANDSEEMLKLLNEKMILLGIQKELKIALGRF